MESFRFIEDPGHGWLEVPYPLVKELGIADQVSSYSYARNGLVYLEEDCDAPLFIRAMKDRLRIFHTRHVYQEDCPIRNYASYAVVAKGLHP